MSPSAERDGERLVISQHAENEATGLALPLDRRHVRGTARHRPVARSPGPAALLGARTCFT